MKDAAEDVTTDAAETAGSGWFPCPYCGAAQSSGAESCPSCGGLFEPLSRQASQNQMGPWFIHDPEAPFMPGRSYGTIRRMAQRGKLTLETVLRGPTTRQFWTAAAETPGVAHLLGRCHSCKAETSPDAFSCNRCGAAFPAPEDRQHLGLGPVRLLPGQAPPAMVARTAQRPASVGPAVAEGEHATEGSAFAELARTATPRRSPRPSTPAPMAPAQGPVAPTRGRPAPTPAPRAAAPEGPDESAQLRRTLRLSNRRVTALRNLVLLLAGLNAIALVALIVIAAADRPAGEPSDSGSAPDNQVLNEAGERAPRGDSASSR